MAFPVPDNQASTSPLLESLQQASAQFGSVLIGASELTDETILEDMANTLVTSAVFSVAAGPPDGLMSVRDVAVVRQTTPLGTADTDKSAFVIDFQRMRTVSQISAGDIRIYRVYPWLGTRFGTSSTDRIYDDDSGTELDLPFAERQTERLIVVTESSTLDHFLDETFVMVPAPPSDLEVLVNGRRVWFMPGAVRPATGQETFSTTVTLTNEIQAAVNTGASQITVTLKSATPGLLAIEVDELTKFRIHNVVFPEGEVRTVVAEQEGLTKLALPVSGSTSSWSIHQVRVTASGEFPATRVQPSDGPEAAVDVQLVLDAEHAAVAKLPASQLDAFANLHAVQILVATGPGGAEVAGVLRADVDAEPGEILEGPSLGPLSLEEIDPEAPIYVTLPLPRPRKLDKLTPLWVAIQVSRGTLIWPVTVPDGAPLNPIRRGLPAGPFRPLPTLEDISPTGLGAVIRVVGEPISEVPIAALDAWVQDADNPARLAPPVEQAQIQVQPPISGATAGIIVDGALQLQLRANTPGTFSFRAAKIIRAD